jgi:glycosyltransferase involved in cell wall biosynthesis
VIPVCHLITSLDAGGAQRMLLNLLRGIDRARFPQRVVTLVGGGALTPAFEELGAVGVSTHSLDLAPGAPDPRGLFRLTRLLRGHAPQVLQTWLYHADLLGLLGARLAGVPHVAWNIRCSDQTDARPPLVRRAVMRCCATLSGRPDVVVVNSAAGQRFHETLGYAPRRWERIPNGFVLAAPPSASGRAAARAALEIDPDAVVALTLARWHPSKGVDLLFEALAREAPPDLVALVAGEGLGPGDARPARLAAEARCDVRLLGLRDDVPRLLAACDFLVCPSRHEGFPNALGEALAAGRPCVTTDAGDAAAIVGEAGRVVPAGDVAALGAAVRELAALGVAERDELGMRGRTRMGDDFSLTRIVGLYEELYAGLAGRTAAA